MMSLSGCDHGCWWEGDALVRRRPRSAMLELRRSVKFVRALSFSCPRELSPVLPKLRHLEVHAVWSPLTASLGYAMPTMRASALPKQSFFLASMKAAKKEAALTQPCVGQWDGASCSHREAEFSEVDGGKKRSMSHIGQNAKNSG